MKHIRFVSRGQALTRTSVHCSSTTPDRTQWHGQGGSRLSDTNQKQEPGGGGLGWAAAGLPVHYKWPEQSPQHPLCPTPRLCCSALLGSAGARLKRPRGGWPAPPYLICNRLLSALACAGGGCSKVLQATVLWGDRLLDGIFSVKVLWTALTKQSWRPMFLRH